MAMKRSKMPVDASLHASCSKDAPYENLQTQRAHPSVCAPLQKNALIVPFGVDEREHGPELGNTHEENTMHLDAHFHKNKDDVRKRPKLSKNFSRRIAHRFPKRRARKHSYPLTMLIPNLVTLLGLCAGVSAFRFALRQQWEFAVIALIVAAIFDTMDGALARMLKASSRFGAELDSLADFATFGLSPAFIMYMLTLKQFASLGWSVVLLFTVCGALRLAKFNTSSIEGTTPEWAKGFFMGTPITSSALLCVLPLVLSLAWPSCQHVFLHPLVASVWIGSISLLMISPIATFSLKKIDVSRRFLGGAVFFVVMLVSALISYPWKTLSVICLCYVLSIPLSALRYKKIQAQCLQAHGT